MKESVQEVIQYLQFHIAEGRGLTVRECERVIEELAK